MNSFRALILTVLAQVFTFVHAAPPSIGKPVPDFELKDLSGKKWKLSDFKGNLIFLNFWATWCPPCIEEFPAMEELNQRLKVKPFVMVAVSVDDKMEEIEGFLKRLGKRRPTFLILHDPDKTVTTKLYGTTKFPETYLIDQNFNLVSLYKGAEDWVSQGHLLEIERQFAPVQKTGKTK